MAQGAAPVHAARHPLASTDFPHGKQRWIPGYLRMDPDGDKLLLASAHRKAQKAAGGLPSMNQLIVFLAAYLYLVIAAIAIVVLLLLPRHEQYAFIVTVLVAFPVAFVIGKLLNHVVYSPRPFVVDNMLPLVSSARDNGFPSDHTLL